MSVGDFSAVVQAQLNGTTVAWADLVRFSFKSQEIRLFQGHGTLIDGNGERWRGLGKLGSLSAVNVGSSGAVQELVLALTADVAMLARIRDDADETTGRTMARYIQFFDVRERNELGEWVLGRALDEPVQIFSGTMGPPKLDRTVQQNPDDPPPSRTITVSAVNNLVNRRKPVLSFFSHRDQLARTGGTDNIFINASRMADTTVRWPANLS